MVTACSTFAEGLLYPSPVLRAPLLCLRLRQLEDLRNRAYLEGEWTNIFSTRSSTSPSKKKMGRSHWEPWDPHHTQTWGPALTLANLQTWPTLCLYPGNREGQYGDRSRQSLAGALKCAPLM